MPFTGGAQAPDKLATGPAAPWLRYRTLRPGQPLLTPHGQPLRSTVVPVRAGYVRLIATEGVPYTLDLMTTGEPYPLAENYGAGAGTVERTGRKDLPTYTRDSLYRQAIPVILTTLKWPGLDIDDEWDALERLARKGNGKRPPVIRLAGPVDHKDFDWTIVGLDPVAESTKRRGHRRVRQEALITVQEWSSVDIESTLSVVKAAGDKPRSIRTTAALNTLRKIAKHYGVDWKRLRSLNKGHTDPDHPIPVGTRIWLPAASEVSSPSAALTGGAQAPG